MKIDPWSSQGSPGTPERLKDAPMPPKRSPRDQKCLPKSSKTAPKINKKRYLQLPESLDPSQNHIISNCLLKVFNHPIIKSSNHRIIQSSSHLIDELYNHHKSYHRVVELPISLRKGPAAVGEALRYMRIHIYIYIHMAGSD